MIADIFTTITAETNCPRCDTPCYRELETIGDYIDFTCELCATEFTIYKHLTQPVHRDAHEALERYLERRTLKCQ